MFQRSTLASLICLPPSSAFRKAAASLLLLSGLLVVSLAGCKSKQASPKAASPKAASPKAASPKAASPKAAAKGLDAKGQLQLSPDDRCPVCGMKVTKHKRFASGIALSDGTTFHFCGTGCMLKSWVQPQVFLGKPKGQLAKAITREYFAGTYIDAKTARWVSGSDVVGAMGPAIVPLKDDADLETFRKRHGGKSTFRLDQLSAASWSKLTGKPALGKHGKHGKHGKGAHGS
jgi:copper chaperone NosL